MMTFASLKAHAETFIATEEAEFKGAWDRFIAWAEGRQAQDEVEITGAKAVLVKHGYTVMEP